jgi:phospholipid/cholesterol/gamma-HCH transport system substrate-binding protein
MEARPQDRRVHPAWWTLLFVIAIVLVVWATSARFTGKLSTYVPVTLTSERAGLVMESGAKVKMRGVQVGRVAGIEGGKETVGLKLDLFPDQVKYIPANVGAEIRATTAFGAKYVELVYPEDPSPKRINSGAVLVSRNVSTEVNTVFENLVDVLQKLDAPKLNAILSAFAEGVRGQGERIGQATTDANEVLLAINARTDTIRRDWRAFKGFNDAYAGAAQDILRILNAASTTSATLTSHAADLDAALLGNIGVSRAGINLIGGSHDNLIRAINVLEPTTNLLMKYNPEYTCLLVGAKWWLDNGAYQAIGGNGRTVILDAAINLGDDPYRYPDNLPIVGAKGGPGGKPGCGSLPDASKNYPVRQLVTNTGWGTGIDIRPNPGIGFPGWANYLPVTRAVPEPPSIRNLFGGPAPGPIPYPGAPPYGADLYADDGTPLWPGLPPAPPPSDQPPPDPNNPPPGAEPFVPAAPAAMTPTPLPPPPPAPALPPAP